MVIASNACKTSKKDYANGSMLMVAVSGDALSF